MLAGVALPFTLAVPERASANTFVYQAGYHRYTRYVYRGHAWLRFGFYAAAAPGFYPSIGYLGFAPPPIYAVPPYPAYAYPAPYYSPAVPYAFGAPAVPSYYGPTVPYYYGAPLPFAPAFGYARPYASVRRYRPAYYDGGYHSYYAHAYAGYRSVRR